MVELRVRPDNENVHFEVNDTGPDAHGGTIWVESQVGRSPGEKVDHAPSSTQLLSYKRSPVFGSAPVFV